MLADLRASPHLDGPCAVVDATWVDDGQRPQLRLVRRRGTYPELPDDGRSVLDLAELIGPDGAPWEAVTRLRCLLDNSGADGGLLEAELVLWFRADGSPARARVAWYSATAGEMRTEVIDDLAAVEHHADDDGETLRLLVDPGDGAAETGRVELSVDGPGGLLRWLPTVGRTREIAFHRCEVERTLATTAAAQGDQGRSHWVTSAAVGEAPLAAAADPAPPADASAEGSRPRFDAVLEEALDPDSGDWRRRLRVADRDVAALTVAYYRLFAGGPDGHRSDRAWRAWALPTPQYGSGQRLHRLLPAVHQRLDDPDSGGEGQLRRFLSVLGLGLDHIRGHADGLSGRHDLGRAAPDQLAALSRWIGWEPDVTAPVRRQRSDVAFAPAVFDTVGTADNLRAVIKRAVGWESETKEFVDNVLLTNAPEPVATWELWSARLESSGPDDPERVTDAVAFDGRPAAAVDADAGTWLFWESDRTGRRTIWLREPGGDEAPALDEGPPGTVDEHPACAVDGDGAVWLFWSSDRSGSRCIWRRPYTAAGAGDAEQVSYHAAPDGYPAAAEDGAGGLWLFWQSARRGPTDIWCRWLRADGTMGPEQRVTAAADRHEAPAACRDADGRLRLFWVADEAGGRSLHTRARDGGGWGEPQRLHAGPWRDESPCAAVADGRLCLLWHSDRRGHWDVWWSRLDGEEWTEPAQVTAHVEPDKEPAAVADGAGLRVWWRSQREGARHRSRTLDTADGAALGAMGTLGDRVHYTYDTGRGPENWYARDTVGVALKPTSDVADPDAALERIADYVESFRPLPVRLVWLSIPARHEDVINTDDLIEEEYSDAID